VAKDISKCSDLISSLI